MKKYIDQLLVLIDKAVKRSTYGVDMAAVPFSGGLDSAVIAHEAGKYTDVSLYTVGIKNCYDFGKAEAAANFLRLPLKKIMINNVDVKKAIPRLIDITDEVNPVKISFGLALYFVAKNTEEEILLSGQGADELFGGYARYLDYLEISSDLLQEEMKKDVRMLISNTSFEKVIAKHFGKELRCPFLDNELIDFCSSLPIECKVQGKERKIILREAAKTIGIPHEIAYAPKKAVQYSSGIMKTMKKMAKEKNMSVKEYIDTIRAPKEWRANDAKNDR